MIRTTLSTTQPIRRLRCDRCDEAATVLDRGQRLCGGCFLKQTLTKYARVMLKA